jgi:DNA helicase HerA-like ATPase
MNQPDDMQASATDATARSGVRAGRVVSTAGSQVIILLDQDACSRGAVEMGSLVTLRGPHATVYGLIEALSTPMPLRLEKGEEMKLAEIGLLGEVPDESAAGAVAFRRGVSKLPSLDAVVTIADQADTAIVYAMPDRHAVRIGSVHQDPRVPAWVSVNDMLCKHFAILGTTGSGKSCAVTVLLKRILAQSPHGHVLLLDPHGEYGLAFADHAEQLSVNSFRLPYWLLNFEELVEVVFGNEKQEAAAEIAHMRELVLSAKLAFLGNVGESSWITVDSPVPYLLGDMNRLLDKALGALDNSASMAAYMRIKARMHLLQTDRRYAFLFDTGLAVRDTLGALLSRLFRIPANGKPLAILDLGSIPSELLSVVVAVICRLAFDFAVWGGQRHPLLLVCEEAHRYAPQDTAQGFEPAKRALSRIAKEGRKYGISLGVISQRPSELASTILSQCNTVFAFRMSNERDQEIIHASLAEASSALFSALPFLGNSEAIAIGEGVPVPMRLRFADLADTERPRSSSVSFTDRWHAALGDTDRELGQLVAALRGHRPGPA